MKNRHLKGSLRAAREHEPRIDEALKKIRHPAVCSLLSCGATFLYECGMTVDAIVRDLEQCAAELSP